MLGDIPGQESCNADGEITREFIKADRQPARLGTDQVHLHDDGHRPGEALIDAEQRVRGDHPPPAGPPGEHERNR